MKQVIFLWSEGEAKLPARGAIRSPDPLASMPDFKF